MFLNRFIKTFVFLLFIGLELSSQELPNPSIIIPPSPQASSLGKYGDYEVNEFTGVPDISVPIYTVDLKDISLPINLTYHGSGIKVDEIASWVGMGWSLNAGGIVTRTVRGRADDSPRGFQNWGGRITPDFNPYVDQAAFALFESFANGIYDSEPDEYFYNFLHKSGKFVVGLQNKPKLLTRDNIVIEPYFIVTDEKGFKFYFEDTESTTPESIGDVDIQSFTSTWYLSRVEDPNGINLFEFEYDYTPYYYESAISETRKEMISGQCRNLQKFYSTKIGINIGGKTLKSIKFAGGRIEFLANIIRQDLPLTRALSKINVYSNNELIKSVDFHYKYQSDRLFLDKILEKDMKDSEEAKTHKFVYNSGSLPPRMSFSQDHWGYYNARYNTTLVPTFSNGWSIFEGADREVNPSVNQAGMLKEITYPTGGRTVFEFESNTYYTTEPLTETSYVGSRMQCTSWEVENMRKWDTTHFELEIDQTVVYTLRYSYDNDMCLGGSGTLYRIRHENGTEHVVGTNLTQQPVNLYLKAGRYTIFGYLECESCSRLRADFSIKYEKRISRSYNKPGPGLRIKSITNYETDTNLFLTRTVYDYADSADASKSSGVLFSHPSYGYVFREVSAHYDGGFTDCQYAMASSNNLAFLGSCRGGLLGYRNVSKISLGKNGVRNGKKVSSYIIDKTAGRQHYPFPPIVGLERRNGLLRAEHIFDSNDKLVKETINDYEFKEAGIDEADRFVHGIKIGYRTKSYMTGIGGGNEFAYSRYDYSESWNNLVQQTVRTFDSEDQKIEEVVAYRYKYDYVFPSVIVTSSSESANRKTEILYPRDFFDKQPYRSMVDKNILKTEVTRRDSINSSLMGGNITEYYNFSQGKIYPKKIKKILKDGSPLNVLEFIRYDHYGNPQEMEIVDGKKIAYLWSYGGQYPIAKIENATYDEVKQALNDVSETFLNQLIAKAEPTPGDLSRIHGLRNAPSLQKAQVTSYTYKPLVGMTSMTDPRGITEYYQYDGFQRLKDVLDFDKNLLQNYLYHYRP